MKGNISCCNFYEYDCEENESNNLSKVEVDCTNTLTSLGKDNLNKLIFAHLNINSIRNKFDNLSKLIRGKVDILLISETKIDDSFPEGQFAIDGFSKPYRLDRNCDGGGLMLFIREDIPSNSLKNEECFYVEINLHNQKWLINCSYNPHKNNIGAYLDSLSKSLDLFSSNFERIILLGDFNVEVDENRMKSFCEIYGLKNLIKQPTCYKNPDKPTCIDLILTNVPRSFQSTCVNNLSKENFIINDNGFKRFCEISLDSLEKHAPRKKKYARGNQMPFFNEELSKAIMTRTKLRSIFLQNKSEENRIRYARQRNFCVSLLRKTKKEYYQNLNEKSVIDNKSFWKTVKPFLSDKTHRNDKIHLIENDELLKTDLETAEVFNEFFSNIVQNLNILSFENDEPIVNNISDLTLKAILKYRKHPGVIAIRDKFKIKETFSFVEVDQKKLKRKFYIWM